MKKILHIAAHMGAGAGKAISGIIKKTTEYKNILLLLEKPANEKFVNICLQNNVDLIITSEVEKIAQAASDSDVIVLNWWGHPLFVNVFKALNKIKSRMLLWSHINGLHYPYLLFNFLEKFDSVMLTSPCTYENQSWSETERNFIKNNSEIVYGMGEFIPETYKYKNDYHIDEKFKIGYTGTLSFNKLNPKFPQICIDVNEKLRDVSFELYGLYTEEIKKAFLCESVKFNGFSDDIESTLINFDIFCYPLVKENFATTENSLLEAMAAGLPIIVLNNPAERNIIIHNKTGLIADTPEQITDYILLLYKNMELRRYLGENARKYVCENYSYENNIAAFTNEICKVLKYEKKIHDFSDVLGNNAWSFFKYFSGKDFESIKKILNGDNSVKLANIYYEKSKGSPAHFYNYYNEEKFKKLM